MPGTFAQADLTIVQNLVFKTGFRFEDVHIDVDDYQTLRITNASGATVTPSFQVKGGTLKYNTGLFNAGLNSTTGIYNGNEGAVKAYNLFNFAASYKVNKNTRLSLGIENLFNEEYFPARVQWFMQPGFYSKDRGTAFTVGVSVRY